MATLVAAGFFCTPSHMADVVFLPDAEVNALAWLAARVWGPALSARWTARTVPARSTTVAVTLNLSALQAATVAAAILLARSSDMFFSIRIDWALAPTAVNDRTRAVARGLARNLEGMVFSRKMGHEAIVQALEALYENPAWPAIRAATRRTP